MSRGDEAPASLAQACWFGSWLRLRPWPGFSCPLCNTWEGTSKLALRPQKGHAAQGARLRWAPGGLPGRGARPPGLLPGWQRRRKGRGAARRGRARPGTRAPASRPPSRRCAGNRDPRVLGGWLRGRGRQAGGDGEGPRAEGAGRNMGGPRAWALLCFGLLLPGGSAAWSVGGAPFSARR